MDPLAPASGDVLVNHVGLTVSDLDRSVAFYRDVVGMRPARSTPMAGGGWFEALTENPGARVRTAVLVAGDFRLQLVEYGAGGVAGRSGGHAAVGAAHLCVNVAGLADRHAALVADGSHRVSPVVDIAGTGNRSFYVFDPDGVPVELLEPAAGGRWP